MTRDEELALLIEEQKRDDIHRIKTLGVSIDCYGGDAATIPALPVMGSAVAFEHGTLNGYNNRRCRCPECRAANTEEMRKYRDDLKEREPWHGTWGGYRHRKCRCEKCRRFARNARRRQRGAVKGRIALCQECRRRFAVRSTGGVRYCSNRCYQRAWVREKRRVAA